MASEIKVSINAKSLVTGGKEVENNLRQIRTSAKQTQDALKKATTVDVRSSAPQLFKFQEQVQGLAGGLQLVGKAGLAATIIAGFGYAALEAAAASERMNNSLLGLKTVAKATGNDMGQVTKAAQELAQDGLAPIGDIAVGLKNLLAKGFSLPEAIKLLKVTKDSAAFGRQEMLSFGDAIRGVTEGIKNENSMMTDNGGITTNLSIMYKEYAATIGTTADKLTDAQKRQAILNGFMKEGERTMGDAAKAADTYTGAKAKLSTAIEKATARLGDFITKSSMVKGTLNYLADYINAITIDKDSNYYIAEYSRQLDGLNKQTGELYEANSGIRKQLEMAIEKLKEQKKLEDQRLFQGEYEAKAKRDQLAAVKAQQEASITAADAEKKRLKEVATLKKQLIDAGKSEIDQLVDLRDRRLALVKSDAEAQKMIWADFYDKKEKLEKKNAAESVKTARQTLKDVVNMQRLQSSIVSESASNPFGVNNTLKDLQVARSDLYAKDTTGTDKDIHDQIHKLDDKIDKGSKAQMIGAGVGALSFAAQGAQGAKGLVSSLAAGGLDMILPGLGQAAKPLLDAFTQGPKETKKMVNEFADALPDVIEGFLKAIPVFIETLADRAPDIITRLAEKAPDIIAKIVEATPRIIVKLISIIPQVAFKFASELIKNLPRIVGEAARAIYEAITRILGQIGDFASGAGDWFSNATGIKLARGGEIPSTAGTAFKDSVPAHLMPSERVLDRGTNEAFKRFVDSGMSGGNDALLSKVIDLLERPMSVSTTALVNDKAFADIILNLNRTKQRMA